MLSANNRSDESNLHLAIMAARLTTKQADNEALFRCNAELAKTNVDLYTRVEHLQDCVQRVSDELDAVTNSISSNSRQSSLTSLNVRQSDDQERQSPPGPSFRRRNESDDLGREHLPAVDEDLDEPVETTLNTSLNNQTSTEQSAQVSVKTKSHENLASTVKLAAKKKKKAKKVAVEHVEKVRKLSKL